MNRLQWKLLEPGGFSRHVRALNTLLSRGSAAALAILFIGLSLSTGIGMARDYHRQNELRNSASQKRVLMLVGEVELGNAVQDFKDCLLRSESSYCEDCDQHIQVLSRTVSLYEAQGTRRPDEQNAVVSLRKALSNYAAAIVKMRDMQARNMTIEEIDAAVKGVDRPIGQGLRELATLADKGPDWRPPVVQSLCLALYAILAGLLIYRSLPLSTRSGIRTRSDVPILPQLSSRLFEWDEEHKANAFLRLHEGVCQSLSGIMYFLKSAQLTATTDVSESVIPSLQAVIQDTRAVALQLRPPKMEASGLLATLRSLWVDARANNAALVMQPRVLIDEADIPDGLKPVILRITRMMIEVAGQSAAASFLNWELEGNEQILRLSMETKLSPEDGARASDRPTHSITSAHRGFDAIQALIVLSGGSLDRVSSGNARYALVCSWVLADLRPRI